jgi:hypothetical protein
MNNDDFLNALAIGDTPAKKPWLGIVYGEPGVNKTGFALYAPEPFFIAFDKNANWITAKTFRNSNNELIVPANLTQANGMIRKLKEPNFLDGIKTIVLDGATFYQDFIHAEIIRLNPVASNKNGTKQTESLLDLGYEGVSRIVPYWDRLIAQLHLFNDNGYNVIIIAHEVDGNATTEGGESYKRKFINLMRYGQFDIPAKLCQAADWVFRLKHGIDTVNRGGKTVAIGGRESSVIVQTRSDSISVAKANSINDTTFPDSFEFTTFDREEICKQIFALIG